MLGGVARDRPGHPMKHQYVADINDYRKYGLLRALTSAGDLSLAVHWMLTPDDASTDGGRLEYAGKPADWRRFDPELFDALAAIISADARRLDGLEAAALFPACFVSEPVPVEQDQRSAHMARSLGLCRGKDLLFFDPDNGLEVATWPPGSRASPKYLYWHEVEAAYGAGHSLLIYQHFPRTDRPLYIRRLMKLARQRCLTPWAASFQTPTVLFLLLPQERHSAALIAGCERVEAAWGTQLRLRREHEPRMPG